MATLRIGGQRRYLYGKTRREVAAKLQDLQKEVARGQVVTPSRLTVREYLTQWLTTVTPRLRASTVVQYEILVRVHISPAIGDVKLTALQPIHLQQLYARILGMGRSARRAEQAHRVLHKALRDAVRLRLLSHNPARDVDAPNGKARERPIWSQEEVRTFIEATSAGLTLYDPLWLFLVGSGCRIGEALGLRFADIDWDASTVLIERGIVHVRNRPEEGPPKTEAGRRRLTLPRFAMEALRHQRELRGGTAIFRNSRGKIPQPTDLLRRFHEACKRVGVPIMRIHDLRKTNATMLVAAGVDVKTVQRRLGHASLGMTLGLYARVVQSGDSLAAQALDTLADGPSESDGT